MRPLTIALFVGLFGLASPDARVQDARGQAPMPYGPPLKLNTAAKIMAAAEGAAKQKKWPVCISIVDSGGHLVMFHRLDNTQLGSVEISMQKAKTAVLFRRPSKAFEEVVANGGVGLKLLKLPGGLPMEGGLPIVRDGKIIGGIGVSGVTSVQDAEIGRAGLQALKPAEATRE
ncbi:MAG: heme-binding protein [Planctomycetota bacterium]